VTVHLTVPLAPRLRPALGGPENASGLAFDRVEEFAIAEWPADALGAARPFDHVFVGLLG
jgi:hypothetical protein